MTTTKKPGGFSLPTNPAAELQKMMIEERARPAGDSSAPPPPATEQHSNIATYEDSKIDTDIATQQRSKLASDTDSNIAIKQRSNIATTQTSEIDSVLAAMLATSLSQLNIRIPDGYNDWLAEEAHKGRKAGVTKQSLVIEALGEFIKRRLAEEGS